MSISFRNRFVRAGLGLTVLLVIFVVGRTFFERNFREKPYEINKVARPVVIGDFTVPPLSGWTQHIERAEDVRRTIFRTTDKGDELEIEIAWFVGRTINPPKKVQDLRQEELRHLKSVIPMYKAIDVSMKPGATEPTKFNGMPAVKTDLVKTSAIYITYGRNTRFLNGSRYYALNWHINIYPQRATRLPELQAKMDKALLTVSNGLVNASS